MMYTMGQLRFSHPRQRARKVKLILDWGVHGRRMKFMDLEERGRCTICMGVDSLQHLAFICLHLAGNRRKEWVADTKAAIHRLTTDGHTRSQLLAEAREAILRELKEMYIRHPLKKCLE